MPIKFDHKNKIFHLYNNKLSYLIKVASSGEILHLYWGKRLRVDQNYSHFLKKEIGEDKIKKEEENNFSLNNVPQEYPAYGYSDFRQPAYQFELDDGSRITKFKYFDHKLIKGKKELDGLPATYVENDDEADSLKIILYDEVAEIKMELKYSIFRDYNNLTRSVKFINESTKNIKIKRVFSGVIDFGDSNFDLITTGGSWARENHLKRRRVVSGLQSVESTRGASSAQHNPFMILARPNTDENLGEAYGFSLVYSGNFYAGVQVNAFEQSRVLMGINHFDFGWLLKEGESFQTPELVLSYTDQGLNGLSQNYHKLYRQRLVRGKYRDKKRPVLINNWEATYFDFTEDKILDIAEIAADVGVELFVLDDGWFKNRDDDTTSLGDWFVDKNKLPNGLDNLVNKINKLGLDFGLWFEPEMISPNSELYKAHPDWCIHAKGRNRTLSRSQLILDLSRSEVREKVLEMLINVLNSANIAYVKWDMNRNMTEIASEQLSSKRQSELAHRYILGLYQILETLKTKFPNILFESCASGGGRFDPGMLYYMPQTWTSDNTDAVERLKIQYGTSMIYPLSTIGAHVSAVPNHQVARITPLKTRADTAFFGNFGYELDLREISATERKKISAQIEFYKKERNLIQKGDFYRLLSPFDNNIDTAWMVVSADKNEALIGYYKVLSEPNAPQKKLRLQGLDPDCLYKIESTNKSYGGDELMYSGIALPKSFQAYSLDESVFKGDFQSKIWKLKKK